MRHIVVTRYNLRATFKQSFEIPPYKDPRWLADRKVLFDRFCLPTMRAQTNRNFDWFVIFDPGTPAEFHDYIHDVATPVFALDIEDAHRQIRASYDGKHDFTVSTRLDNDDGFSVDMIDATQKLALAIGEASGPLGLPHVINFRDGWEYDCRTDTAFLRQYPKSSFFSLVEGHVPAGEMKLASSYKHALEHKSFNTTNVSSDKPIWIMSIHGDNIGNAVTGEPAPRKPGDLQDLFSIS